MSDFTQRTKSKSQYRPQTRCVRTDLQCPELEDVRISSRALEALISQMRTGIRMDRDPGASSDISDQRGRVIASIEKVRNSVTPQMLVDMVACYEAGASIREVAETCKVHQQTVARHLRSAGVKLRKSGLTDEQAARAEVMYLSGQNLAQVGAELGVSQGTVGRCLRNRGVKLRPPLGRAHECI